MIMAPAWIDGRSRVVMATDPLPPMPGMAKISSTTMIPPSSSRIDGDDGDGRQSGIAQDVVASSTVWAGQALHPAARI